MSPQVHPDSEPVSDPDRDCPPILPAAEWVRAARRARRLSQRELAELVGVSRATIDRIESGRGSPGYETLAELLSATGYLMIVVDRHGRPLRAQDPSERLFDKAGRRLPMHLHAHRTPAYGTLGDRDTRPWWGWHHIAWYEFGPTVPTWTYWKRGRPPRVVSPHPWGESGLIWDDAT